MNNNTFFISDASYCSIRKIASIASMCPFKNITETKVLENIESINHAETSALLLSIKLAVKNNIKNAVFIYDNKTINKRLIEEIYKDQFECIQLLWVKRDLIKPVDKIARDTFNNLVFITEKEKEKINVVEIFKSYDDKLKIKAALKIATQKESVILNTFLRSKYSKDSIDDVKLKNTKLFRFIYQMLNDKTYKQEFYEYLCLVSLKVKRNTQFKQMEKNDEMFEFIEKMKCKINPKVKNLKAS